LSDLKVSLPQWNLTPKQILPSITAGIVTGLIGVVLDTSLASLIFSGSLSEYIAVGIGVVLVAGILSRVVVAAFSSFPGSVAAVDSFAAAIIAIMATTISQTVSETEGNILLTILFMSSFSALLTGGFMLMLASFKAGNLVRFIPYSVFYGFVAGSGWLLFRGSLNVMTNLSLSWGNISELWSFGVILKLIFGSGFAIALLLINRRYSHFLITPTILLIGVIIVHSGLLITGTSFSTATDQGWLLAFSTPELTWHLLDWVQGSQVHWQSIFSQMSGIIAIVGITTPLMLLESTSIELQTQQDVDLNQELKTFGLANLFISLSGGLIGNLVITESVLAYRMGARSRLVGFTAAGVFCFVLFIAPTWITYLPQPLLGAILMFQGLDLLMESLYESWSKIPLEEYLVLLLIVGVIAGVGVFAGLGVGLVLAVTLFVINYSRIGVTKWTFSFASLQSNVERSPQQAQCLKDHGEQLFGLELQGMIFFGTATKVVEQVQQRIQDSSRIPVRFVLLDFRRVVGLDSSALLSFLRLKYLAQKNHFYLVFTGLPSKIKNQLIKGDCLELDSPLYEVFSDRDRGLEWCENQILAECNLAENQSIPIIEQFQDIPLLANWAERLMTYLTPVHLEAGETLFSQGDAADDLYFVESGRVSVIFALSGGKTKRFRTYSTGTIIGEIGLYHDAKRSASVIADENSTLYRLSKATLSQIERTEPELATAFHKFIVNLLAERILYKDREVASLLE